MDIQDKHRVTLLNAKCEVVCKVQSMLKKMDYGEDVSCCSERLFAAIKLINRLDCYCFGTINETEVLSVFTFTVAESNTSANISVSLKINSKQSAYLSLTTARYKPTVIEVLLSQTRLEYTSVSSGGFTTFTITGKCDTETISFVEINSGVMSTADATNAVAGVCIDSCHNCISDSDLPKAYAVLAALLQ